MEYKKRILFISIALNLLIGCLAEVVPSILKAEDAHFSSLAETTYFHDIFLEQEETTVSEQASSSIPHIGDALRHFSKTMRSNSSPSSKYGFTIAKRNQILYVSSLNIESPRKFSSKLSDGRRRLISFGKLVI